MRERVGWDAPNPDSTSRTFACARATCLRPRKLHRALHRGAMTKTRFWPHQSGRGSLDVKHLDGTACLGPCAGWEPRLSHI